MTINAIMFSLLEWIKTNYQFIITSSISIAALVMSFISITRTKNIQKLEEIIKENEVKKILEEENKHLVEARMTNKGNGHYYVKIWNSGNHIAKNVDIKCNPEPDYYDKNLILPLEILEPSKSVELRFACNYETPKKFQATIEWEDENGVQHVKESLLVR